MQNSNVDWITTKELAEIKGISERAVRKSIAKNKYVIRKSSKSYEILVTSLEESVRKKITERREKSTALVPINYVVPEEQKKLALAKYDLIKNWDKFRNEKLHKELFKLNIPTIEQVILVLNAWLQKYHYEQPCPHVEGKTIGEVLESGKGEGVNIETLDDLMMAREIKKIQRNGIKFLKNDYYDPALYGYKKNVIIKYSLFNLNSIKVFKLNGEFMCEAMRVEPINPLANYIGTPKDIEDLKQKTKLKKQLEKRTEKEFINQLKRNQVHTPLLSMDLPEKQENEEVEQLRIEIKEKAEKEFFNGCFRTRFEKYEHLINKENLTQTEQDWIKEYEKTDEYEQIYGEDKEISDAQIVC